MLSALQSYERHIAPFARPFAESTVRHATRCVASSNDVLDHGAGTGLVTSLLLRRRPHLHVTALDPNADLLSALTNEPRCRRIVGTAADLPSDGAPFGLVMSNLVLPFCSDAAADLAHLRERTSSSGTLVITTLGSVPEVTPFHRFWSAAHDVLSDAWDPTRYPHHRFGDPDVFADVVRAGGWSVRSVHRVRAVRRISGDRAWTWLSSVLPVGRGDAYGSLSDDERHAIRNVFLGRWSTESCWVSSGWTVVATT
jgi:SAM-dependent methyltransferase